MGVGVSLSIHINVMNYLLVLLLRGEDSNKLRGLGYFRKGKSRLQSCLKNLRQDVKVKDFQKDRMFFIEEYVF